MQVQDNKEIHSRGSTYSVGWAASLATAAASWRAAWVLTQKQFRCVCSSICLWRILYCTHVESFTPVDKSVIIGEQCLQCHNNACHDRKFYMINMVHGVHAVLATISSRTWTFNKMLRLLSGRRSSKMVSTHPPSRVGKNPTDYEIIVPFWALSFNVVMAQIDQHANAGQKTFHWVLLISVTEWESYLLGRALISCRNTVSYALPAWPHMGRWPDPFLLLSQMQQALRSGILAVAFAE